MSYRDLVTSCVFPKFWCYKTCPYITSDTGGAGKAPSLKSGYVTETSGLVGGMAVTNPSAITTTADPLPAHGLVLDR